MKMTYKRQRKIQDSVILTQEMVVLVVESVKEVIGEGKGQGIDSLAL